MIGKGGLLVNLAGKRKPTAVLCSTCHQWVDTARGLAPERGHAADCLVPDYRLLVSIFGERDHAPAFIPAHRLGSKRRATGVPLRMEGP
jgi:hypothetical protein